jgi:SAM-dependent methyltransferase
VSLLRRWSRISAHSVYRQWRQNQLERRAGATISAYLQEHSVRKLHLGAGGIVLDGWLNADLSPQHPQVIYLDAASAWPLEAGVLDYVHSEHLLEHLELGQQAFMLREALRVLKPGGVLRTATPNFDVIVALPADRSAFADEYRRWSARTYFPEQVALLGEGAAHDVFVINNYFQNWGHQFIHNPWSLRLLLERVGFTSVRQAAVNESSDPELRGLERHGTVIPPEYNAFETMVFEAAK